MRRLVDTRLAPHVGLCRPIRPPRNLVLNITERRSVDPATGIVYGAGGTPVGYTDPRQGYVRIGITQSGHQYAHRLVYVTCQGSIPEGHYIDHRNGRKGDNRLRNLDAVTPAENSARACERGSVVLGADRSNAKLTATLVREIRRSTLSNAEWAQQLDVDRASIRQVRDGTTWRHVPLRGRLPAKPRWRRPT